ncbi:hypothetical protein ACLM5H_25580 [Fredinandcohnia humi]
MKRLYSQKYDVFKHSISEYQFDGIDWIDTNAGLHVFGSWVHSESEYALFEKECASSGVTWQSANTYYNFTPSQRKVIFGFSHLS